MFFKKKCVFGFYVIFFRVFFKIYIPDFFANLTALCLPMRVDDDGGGKAVLIKHFNMVMENSTLKYGNKDI